MTSSQPTVSIIIPARDAAESLPAALASVREQDYPNIIEVIVAAADASSSAAAEGAIVISNSSGSTPTGLNLAIARATGEVIVRCDAQSRLPQGYVSRAVETLERTRAGAVGGMQVPVGTTKWEKAAAAAMRSPLGAGDARYRLGGEEGPVETVYLGVFSRETLDRLGGYDERFTRTQDYELNHRIIESGAVVWFDPELAVEYRPRDSLKALARQYYEYGRAKRRFASTHPGALRWRQLAPPLLVAVLVLALVASIWLPISLIVPAGYVLALLLAGVMLRRPLAGLALGVMHISWGLGFLVEPRAVTP